MNLDYTVFNSGSDKEEVIRPESLQDSVSIRDFMFSLNGLRPYNVSVTYNMLIGIVNSFDKASIILSGTGIGKSYLAKKVLIRTKTPNGGEVDAVSISEEYPLVDIDYELYAPVLSDHVSLIYDQITNFIDTKGICLVFVKTLDFNSHSALITENIDDKKSQDELKWQEEWNQKIYNHCKSIGKPLSVLRDGVYLEHVINNYL